MSGNVWFDLKMSYEFGTLFAQTVLAGLWVGFGPLRLPVRLPLGIIWLSILLASHLRWIGHEYASNVVTEGLSMVGGWLLVLVPALVVSHRWNVCVRDALQTAIPSQFHIRDIMLLTGVVAVAFGVARGLIGPIDFSEFELSTFVVRVILVTLDTIVATVPFVIAILLTSQRLRYAMGATILILSVAAVKVWLATLFVSGSDLRGGHSDDRLHYSD